jgi:hypothetical protein
MKIFKQIVCWTALLLTVALFSGCGTSPTGPAPVGGGLSGGGGDPNPAPLGPEILVVNPDGTTSWAQLPPSGGYPASGGFTEPGVTTNKLSVAERVDGSVGAKMRCGRFYLMIPPGTFDGIGTVTMTMEDSTVMVCDLEVYPQELNSFKAPVDLVLCVNDTNVNPDTLSIYWNDTEKNTWVAMGCSTDLSAHTGTASEPFPVNATGVMTELRHFSRYSGGKAGW